MIHERGHQSDKGHSESEIAVIPTGWQRKDTRLCCQSSRVERRKREGEGARSLNNRYVR